MRYVALMKKFTLRHEINCSVDEFWKVFFDKEFNVTLFTKELGFPEFEVLQQEETDTKITRTVRGMPKMDVPRPVAKLLGDGFSYEESGTFDRSQARWQWTMTPAKLAGKLLTQGSVICEAAGEGKCTRIASIEVEAKIFGVGGLIESTSEKQMTDGWNHSARYMNRWLQDHPAT